MTTAPVAGLARLLDPAVRPDPYPLYAELRAAGPIAVPGGPVVFARHQDCQALLRHPDVSSDRRKAGGDEGWTAARRLAEHPAVENPPFLRLDPPDHTRLRRLVSSAFTPAMIQRLRPFMTALVDDLLDRVAERGKLEVIDDLAYPLPVAVICRLLGVPLADEPLFHGWSETLAAALDPIPAVGADADRVVERQLRAATELREYLAGLVARRRQDPGDDLISALIAAHDDESRLSEGELVSTCVLLLIAGHETTVNLIANATLALLRHPDQWAALAADPGRVSAVVSETLRYDPPVQLIARIATADLAIGGGEVPAGGVAILLIGATGRDPEIAPDPDVFDPDRAEVRTLAFAMGPHYCLGAPLARLEAQLALTRLAQRLGNPRLAAEPLDYKPNLVLRGLRRLAVDLDTAAPRSLPWPA